jgi:transcription antitermination factor NusA-like protein
MFGGRFSFCFKNEKVMKKNTLAVADSLFVLNKKFEKPKNGILSKTHKLLLANILTNGISPASTEGNKKSVELISNPPTSL